MSSFTSAFKRLWPELEKREKKPQLLKFGISYLDDALLGIFPDDLILLGAKTGAGKTQICVGIALANARLGKRVHFIALEASEFEIERRIKFQIISQKYFDSKIRVPGGLCYDRWVLGDFLDELAEFEIEAIGEMEMYKSLFIFYKEKNFGVNDLIEAVVGNADKSDLFIIDHAHYFDLDDDNENRGMKNLAKMVRTLAIENNVPIVLAAHLRKSDRGNPELVPDLDEFHGSSDLAKISTRVITIAPGKVTQKGSFETFFRIPKNRMNGGIARYVARLVFNPEKGTYEEPYRLGYSTCTKADGFQDICEPNAPQWAKRLVASIVGGVGDRITAPRPKSSPLPHWQKDI